jgi:hypothetical protein
MDTGTFGDKMRAVLLKDLSHSAKNEGDKNETLPSHS